jgi:SM-20-related protein
MAWGQVNHDILPFMTSKNIAVQLGRTGLCVCPGFLSAKALRNTADDFDSIRASGRFHRAGIGRGPLAEDQTGVRNDETFWLDRGKKSKAHFLLWRKLDLLKRAFNRSLFLGLTGFEGQYSAYPEGGYYGRHKDSFRDDSARIVSFVLYLNRDWRAAHGGRLRVYATELNGTESHTDVDPIGGTMVCFMSGESEHEVLESHRPRFSLAGWFKRERQIS